MVISVTRLAITAVAPFYLFLSVLSQILESKSVEREPRTPKSQKGLFKKRESRDGLVELGTSETRVS